MSGVLSSFLIFLEQQRLCSVNVKDLPTKITKCAVELLLFVFKMCFVRMAVSGIYTVILLSAVPAVHFSLEF